MPLMYFPSTTFIGHVRSIYHARSTLLDKILVTSLRDREQREESTGIGRWKEEEAGGFSLLSVRQVGATISPPITSSIVGGWAHFSFPPGEQRDPWRDQVSRLPHPYVLPHGPVTSRRKYKSLWTWWLRTNPRVSCWGWRPTAAGGATAPPSSKWAPMPYGGTAAAECPLYMLGVTR